MSRGASRPGRRHAPVAPWQLAVAAALLAPAIASADQCLSDVRQHECARAGDPKASCTAAVAADSLDLQARLTLCQLHLDRQELADAAIVLQRGLDMCGNRSSACSTLRLALSNVNEQRMEAERTVDPAELRREREAQRSYCMGPVSTDRSINACEQLLAAEPEDATLHKALGSKLLSKGEPARAITSLERAMTLNGEDPAIAKALNDARQQRQVLVSECLNDSSLADCDAALLPGERDEYLIQRQRGVILVGMGQDRQALHAFLTAQSLRENDATTARALLALTPDAVGDDRIDLLQAQIAAARLLENTDAEIAALSHLVRLQPQNQRLQAQLARLLDPPEPADPGTVTAPADDVAAESPEPASPTQQTASTLADDPPDPVQPVSVDQFPERRPSLPAERPEVAAQVAYVNAIREDGRTH